MNEEKNIPGKPPVPPDEHILSYLNKVMSDPQQHDFEKTSAEDEFMSDAMEGLAALHTKTDVKHVAQKLNADLKKQIEKKNKRKDKRKYHEQPWTYFAVILLLLLLIAAFIVVRQLN